MLLHIGGVGCVSKSGLNTKQKTFCHEYIVDLNATQAAIRAGYSVKTAKAMGHENLTKPDIQTFIAVLMDERGKKTEITAERVVQELAKVAFASMRHFIRVDENGQPQINLGATDNDNLDALMEVTTETVVEARGSGDEREFDTIRKTKIKLHNKLGALHELAEHTGVFAKRDKDQANGLAAAWAEIMSRSNRAPIYRDKPDDGDDT
jgi:phage terminase small subunit